MGLPEQAAFLCGHPDSEQTKEGVPAQLLSDMGRTKEQLVREEGEMASALGTVTGEE